jgi:hypothetical protein
MAYLGWAAKSQAKQHSPAMAGAAWASGAISTIFRIFSTLIIKQSLRALWIVIGAPVFSCAVLFWMDRAFACPFLGGSTK